MGLGGIGAGLLSRKPLSPGIEATPKTESLLRSLVQAGAGLEQAGLDHGSSWPEPEQSWNGRPEQDKSEAGLD